MQAYHAKPQSLRCEDQLISMRRLAAWTELTDLYHGLYVKAAVGRIVDRLTGRHRGLSDLSVLLEHATITGCCHAGVQAVPLERIIGSESRSSDFDHKFRPLISHDVQRWLRVAQARHRGEVLPAVDLVEIDGGYYVRDGHHRISVARAMGESSIDAQVTHYEVGQRSIDWDYGSDCLPRAGALMALSQDNVTRRAVGTSSALGLAALLVVAFFLAGPPLGVNGSTVSAATHAAMALSTCSATPLGTLGGDWSMALDINDQGQTVGVAADGRTSRAALWTAQDGLQDLGTAGGAWSLAFGINHHGQVVGKSETLHGLAAGFVWSEQDGMQTLGTLGGRYGCAHRINDRGQVVGESTTPADAQHAFLWTADQGMRDLGTLGGENSSARGINAHGHVAGDSLTQAGDWHAFIWTPEGGMRDIGALGGVGCWATRINDQGVVVGYAMTTEDVQRAWRWTAESGMVVLPTLGGERNCALGLNDLGQAAGWSEDAQGQIQACVWAVDGAVYRVGQGANRSLVMAINNHGQTAGEAGASAAKSQAVFWSLPD